MTNKKIKLAKDFTIEDFEKLEEDQNKERIANFVFQRLSERYLDPIENSTKKNGFSIMANSCLLIETYESFRQGWKDTKGPDFRPFDLFFEREPGFKDFKYGYSNKFYHNVRCGILHQGETTGGWKITRLKEAPIFNKAEKTINATKFFNELRKSLEAYRDLLITADWDSEVWVNCRKKISFIIENCK
jgi:hypothetical protein